MEESSELELKEKYTKTFLKTVSAYANYKTGKILFGVDNKGNIVGVEDSIDMRLAIENAINDSLDPVPNFTLKTRKINGKQVVELKVFEGSDKPYLSSGKAYKRADTSTVAVDRAELKRLSIEGSQCPFDEMPSKNQDLSFEMLGKNLKVTMDLNDVSEATLKTLGLLKGASFNNAAALLSDENDFPGLEIVRYSHDFESISERITLESVSVLLQLERALEEFRKYYIVEKIGGFQRVEREIVPEASFREALANALLHRVWYANARTIVSFYDDRIEIVSPGGLPADVDEELYLSGGVSVPRNACLALVFLRLGLIERLGTGIMRIRKSYTESVLKPEFTISDKAIRVMLPVIDDQINLSKEESRVYEMFQPGQEFTSAELERKLGLSRSTILRSLGALCEKGLIVKLGKARATRYRLP